MLGVGLAMDAFSVSVANGLSSRNMNTRRAPIIAGTFAAFQFLMPMIGWILVHAATSYLKQLERYIPWIALLLLVYIGSKMVTDGLRERAGKRKAESDVDTSGSDLTASTLMLQGIATSIDALSVGFTTAAYDLKDALLSSFIIGAVTFVICMAGVAAGRKAGSRLTWKASVLGGVILIIVGLRIFID